MARQHASDGMAAAGRGGGARDGDQLGFGVLDRCGLLVGYYLVIAFRKIYIYRISKWERIHNLSIKFLFGLI
jgi:hypothetical protein